MVCCVCGKDVAGLPVMRDNRNGLECCEACAFELGGPAEFIKYVDSGEAIRGVQKPAVSRVQKSALSPQAEQELMLGMKKAFHMDDASVLKKYKSMSPAERRREKQYLETTISTVKYVDPELVPEFQHNLALLRTADAPPKKTAVVPPKKTPTKTVAATPKKSFLDRIRGR